MSSLPLLLNVHPWNGQVNVPRLSFLRELHAVDLGHAQIADHQIDVVLLEHAERLLAVFRRVHVVAVAFELGAEHAPQVRLVVDDQDLFSLGEHHG